MLFKYNNLLLWRHKIDGDVEEAVYESVHVADENIQPLDGRIAQRNYDNARNEYSEIGASVAM